MNISLFFFFNHEYKVDMYWQTGVLETFILWIQRELVDVLQS